MSKKEKKNMVKPGKTNLKRIKRKKEKHEENKENWGKKTAFPLKSLQNLDVNKNNKKKGVYYFKILPPIDDNGIPWVEFKIHYNLGEDGNLYHVCINDKSKYKGKCGSCKRVKKMYKSGNEEEAKQKGRQFKYVFNVWDFDATGGKDDPYIKGLVMGSGLWEEITGYFEDYGDLTDLKEGYVIKIKRKKFGMKSRYISSCLNKKDYKLSKEERSEVLEGLHDLTKFMPSITPEEIEEIWEGSEETDSENYISDNDDNDEDDDVKKKKKKNKKKSRKEDEEDDNDGENDDSDDSDDKDRDKDDDEDEEDDDLDDIDDEEDEDNDEDNDGDEDDDDEEDEDEEDEDEDDEEEDEDEDDEFESEVQKKSKKKKKKKK